MDEVWAKLFLLNVWLGVSCEDQARAEERIPDLLATPAAVRFVSAEPLLGPIDFNGLRTGDGAWITGALTGDYGIMPENRGRQHLDWIICGGESGTSARPMQPDWARSIRDPCAAADTAFFFKQWGEWLPAPDDLNFRAAACWASDRHFGKTVEHHSSGNSFVKVGKKKAGRLLDGIEHNGYPDASPAKPEA